MRLDMEAKRAKKRQKMQKEFFAVFLPFFCPFCFSFFPPKVSYQIRSLS